MNFKKQREDLVNSLKSKGITRKNVLNAMMKVKRELFIPKFLKDKAYEDIALPIKNEQTISQPYTVAYMLQELEIKKTDKILEIGTGSGYNAALLSKLTKKKVYTTEIIKELVDYAKQNLKKAKIKNIEIIHSDGSLGYEKEAPYNKIIVTAACPEIPQPLVEQLKNKGIIIAPVGVTDLQFMVKARKKNGILEKENLGGFSFVSLTGKYGY